MTAKKFTSDAKLTEIRETEDGFMVGRVRCARTGIQYYNADELGQEGGGVIALYRPENEVFAKDSLKTYAGKPFTNNHPPEAVDAKNWKQYAGGDIGEDVLRDGEYVNVSIAMMDKSLIDAYKAGKKELSMGYTHNVDFVDGVAPCGTPYQAISRDLKMNHLALVDRGRAGHECRVGDSSPVKWGVSPITNDEETKVTIITKNVIVDGLTVETTDAGAQAIDKLQKVVAAKDAEITTNAADHAKALAAKDAKIDAQATEIKTLKDSQLDDAAIDAKVAQRAELISDAKLISGDAELKGTDDEVRAIAVTEALGADSIDGKDAAYVNARFDIAVEDAKKDSKDKTKPFQKAVKDSKGKVSSNDNGQADYEQRTRDAWKPEVNK